MKLRKIEKKGAIELSLSTIVVVVLALTLLILGFVLVRSIMCSAIGLTGEVNDKIRDQINSFFSSSGAEFTCIGESGSPVTMIPGETNIVYCGVNAPQAATYEFDVSVNDGASTIPRESLMQWFQDMNFNQRVAPGDEIANKIALVRIPDNAPEGDFVLNVEVSKDGEFIGSRILNYKVSRQGLVSGFIC